MQSKFPDSICARIARRGSKKPEILVELNEYAKVEDLESLRRFAVVFELRASINAAFTDPPAFVRLLLVVVSGSVSVW